MLTIALRFADNFAPDIGTIQAHQDMIDKYGFVWYGKLGAAISESVISEIKKNEIKKVLLIHSGKRERYWAYIEELTRNVPERKYIPEYYRDSAGIFKTWMKICRIEEAPLNVMSHCHVKSSGRPLSEVSKSSMSPYFIIMYDERD